MLTLIDIDDLEVNPKIFAKLLGVSVTKLAQGKVSDEKTSALTLRLQELRADLDTDLEDWLTSPLPIASAEVRPVDVWKHGADPIALIDSPEEELDRCCPSWKLLYYKKGVRSQ